MTDTPFKATGLPSISNRHVHRNMSDIDPSSEGVARHEFMRRVGGEEVWNDMHRVAEEHWTDAEFDEFNAAAESGDPTLINKAMKKLKADHDKFRFKGVSIRKNGGMSITRGQG